MKENVINETAEELLDYLGTRLWHWCALSVAVILAGVYRTLVM